jgi:hypothetical protein
MNFEEQLLIGGLLMTIAVLSASHAHARPVPARVLRVAALTRADIQNPPLISFILSENRNATPIHAAP